MEQIRNLSSWFKNISQEQVLDLIVAVIIAILFYIISSLAFYLVVKITGGSKKIKVKQTALYIPIKVFTKVFSIYLGMYIVNLPPVVMAVINKIMKIIIIYLVADAIARLISPKAKVIKKLEKSNKFEKIDHTMVKYLSKVARGIIYIIAGFIIINELGYNLTGLITGFGLSSVVIALAAQDFAKNLIAGASILMDKSYKIGDWLQVGTDEGTVEHISIKSTRLRAIDDSIIIIPNSTMVSTSVVNWSNLEKRRYSFDLRLPLNTKESTIEKIKSRISFVLATNKNVIENSVKVNFSKIQSDALEIAIYLYTDIIAFENFLEFKTDINMKILGILEEEQINLAYPGKDIYIRGNN
ncbi:MAG: mechanosensitive ion channel family protein [Clostridia bacterium]|nr:mechanosensitive ion channel family protein [Clostridia bacterium]